MDSWRSNKSILFFNFAQLYAAAVMVLLINPRGSTGYGQDFCKAIYADWEI
jgi:dipeptidyl aminopeptidase/acylaminoacyl peptidase